MSNSVSFLRSTEFAQAAWSDIKSTTNNWTKNLPYSGEKSSNFGFTNKTKLDSLNLNVVGSKVNPIRTEKQLAELVSQLKKTDTVLAPSSLQRLTLIYKIAEAEQASTAIYQDMADIAQDKVLNTIKLLGEIYTTARKPNPNEIQKLERNINHLNLVYSYLENQEKQIKTPGYVSSLELENQFDPSGATHKLKINKFRSFDQQVYLTSAAAQLWPSLIKSLDTKK